MNESETTRHERGLARLNEVDGEAGEQVVAGLGDLGRYIVELSSFLAISIAVKG